MMASNALSKRRQPLRRPKVCHESPNPGRCHPPEPPPPPPWPPDNFDLRWIVHWNDGFDDFDFDVIIPMVRDLPLWEWNGVYQPVIERWDAWWGVNDSLHTAILDLFSDFAMEFVISYKENIPVVWDLATDYDITTWDAINPDPMDTQALFTF